MQSGSYTLYLRVVGPTNLETNLTVRIWNEM